VSGEPLFSMRCTVSPKHVRAAFSGPFQLEDALARHRNQRLAFMSTNQSSKPIEIKISTVVAVSAILHTADLATLDAAMQKMTGGASDYFDHEFAVIDVASCEFGERGIDWPALINLFKTYSLNPVAVRGAPTAMEAAILASGLSIDTLVQPRQEMQEGMRQDSPPEPEPAPVAASVQVIHAEPAPAPSAMIVDKPVRAGQRIYARGSDLIVTAIVNNGAELIADGSIHVYAPLRGRALAGASGNAEARIFALCMEAELVSIAGIYRTFESGLPKDMAKQAAQVRLTGDRIDVLAIRA
jgi:septum site-determining protein MinC